MAGELTRPRHAEVNRLVESSERAYAMSQKLEQDRLDMEQRRFAMYREHKGKMDAKLHQLHQKLETLSAEKESWQRSIEGQQDTRSRQASDKRAPNPNLCTCTLTYAHAPMHMASGE